MIFQYLGTAAAEGWPAMFCKCDNCKRAIAAGGRNIRTRSQAVIDGTLLIDFPADTYSHVLNYKLDLSNIHHLIITHDHSDHLYPADFEMRRKGFAYLDSEEPLTVYETEPSDKLTTAAINEFNLGRENRVLSRVIKPFIPFQAVKYTITALNADHCAGAVFYSISDGEKAILYAHDTGYFPDDTWDYLERTKPRFDFVSLDCTAGITESRHGHMGLSVTAEVKDRLIKMGCADKETIFCLNHFSHNGKAIYDELIPEAKKLGFIVSFDGMKITI